VSTTPAGPPPTPALIAEATKRAGLIWIAVGKRRPHPAWHVWRAGPGPGGLEPPGAAYVLTGLGEQPLPGLAEATRVTVIAASSPAGAPVTWTAAVSRVEPGSGEWDEVIGPLVAGRLNAVLPPGETSPAPRWAQAGTVFRLTPILPAQNSRSELSNTTPAVNLSGRRAGHSQRRPLPNQVANCYINAEVL
jgi:hypothetical protein